MTRNLQAIRCLCGSEPFCPFHAARITGESAIDRCYREAREHVRSTRLRGERDEYGRESHAQRRTFDLAVMAESTKRLEAIGVEVVVGLATEESIAAQRAWAASMAKPSAPHPTVKPIPRGTMHHSIAKTVSPGYMLFRIPHLKDGVIRDSREAAADFAQQPWANQVRYLGSNGTSSTDGVYLFERPDPRQRRLQRERTQAALVDRKQEDVLATIRQYQTKAVEE